MSELYKIADQLVAELKRIRDSGTDMRTLVEYKFKILDYLEKQIR
jgi:hypothetical protein